jgi:hypothetical protein
MDYGELKWVKLEKPANCVTYQLGNEPELIHIITTGFKDTYMVLFEDAYELTLGDCEILSKAEIGFKFNIIL